MQSWHSGFADWHDIIEDIFCAGDRVAVRWRSSGTHTGTFAGVASTGKRLELTGIDIMHIKDGRIAEHWSQTDITGFIQRPRDGEG